MSLIDSAVTVVRVPAEFAFGVAKKAGETALGAARTAYGAVTGGDAKTEQPPEWADSGVEPPAREPSRPARPRRRARPSGGNGRQQAEPAAPAAATSVAEPPVAEPAHVSEEPELVAEVAEEGAEDGAGAEVHIDEPWPGYDGMTAADIVDRLVAEPAEVAAAVQLYETSRKGRAQVLEASAQSIRD